MKYLQYQVEHQFQVVLRRHWAHVLIQYLGHLYLDLLLGVITFNVPKGRKGNKVMILSLKIKRRGHLV